MLIDIEIKANGFVSFIANCPKCKGSGLIAFEKNPEIAGICPQCFGMACKNMIFRPWDKSSVIMDDGEPALRVKDLENGYGQLKIECPTCSAKNNFSLECSSCKGKGYRTLTFKQWWGIVGIEIKEIANVIMTPLGARGPYSKIMSVRTFIRGGADISSFLNHEHNIAPEIIERLSIATC